MISISQLSIAVIGDKALVSGLRLVGVSQYYVIKDNHGTAEEVRQALTELIGKPEIGIIAIQEDYSQYVGDLMTQVQEGKNLTPVIIEVPSKYGTKHEDVSEYYRAYIRKIIGFDVEI